MFACAKFIYHTSRRVASPESEVNDVCPLPLSHYPRCPSSSSSEHPRVCIIAYIRHVPDTTVYLHIMSSPVVRSAQCFFELVLTYCYVFSWTLSAQDHTLHADLAFRPNGRGVYVESLHPDSFSQTAQFCTFEDVSGIAFRNSESPWWTLQVGLGSPKFSPFLSHFWAAWKSHYFEILKDKEVIRMGRSFWKIGR